MLELTRERIEGLAAFLGFAARACGSIPLAILRYPGEVLTQFERVAVHSMAIVAGAGICVGLVMWFQTHRLLVAHGAQSALPSFLAVAMLVEIGPALAGLLVAGRVGAGLAAELAAMVVNEEIDARMALGAPPVTSLVAPRALACALAVPFLTVLIDASALGGALLAEMTAGRSSVGFFWSQSLKFLTLADIVPATLKTAVFGLLIGVIACWTGLRADRSAEAVGKAATAGVVRSTLTVFASNAILVPLIQAIAKALE